MLCSMYISRQESVIITCRIHVYHSRFHLKGNLGRLSGLALHGSGEEILNCTDKSFSIYIHVKASEMYH